jgi:hypothetical protein
MENMTSVRSAKQDIYSMIWAAAVLLTLATDVAKTVTMTANVMTEPVKMNLPEM